MWGCRFPCEGPGGWFGGPGPEGTEQMMKGLDMHPARQNAQAAS